MARGSSQATGAATTASDLANTYSGNAASLFSTLEPTLATEAAHPAGMAPTDLAAATTAGMQTGGGTQAAATGQGALRAARTRNIGGGDAAIASAARSGGQQESNAAFQTVLKNSALKQTQQQAGIKGMEGLFSENLAGGNQALGQVAGDVNANTNAETASWDWAKDLADPLLSDVTQIGLARIKANAGGGS